MQGSLLSSSDKSSTAVADTAEYDEVAVTGSMCPIIAHMIGHRETAGADVILHMSLVHATCCGTLPTAPSAAACMISHPHSLSSSLLQSMRAQPLPLCTTHSMWQPLQLLSLVL